MAEKKFKKRIEFQQKIVERQKEQIEKLKLENEKLKQQCAEKDKLINSVDGYREELLKEIENIKKSKAEYSRLIKELQTMKTNINQIVYKGRWNLVKFLIK